MICYLADPMKGLPNPARKAVVVCPGGGYQFHSPREAEPIAKNYFAKGFQVFVLYYSLYPQAGNYQPLIEVSAAIAHIRENCETYTVDPNNIFVVGFSAGGHLAASAGTLWNCSAVRQALGVDAGLRSEGINRPTGTILCYPVITGGKFAHRPSIDRVCGNKKDLTQEEIDVFSLEKQVDETTAPCFIWHTFADQLVPVENALLYMNALRRHQVPFEAHIFPYGRHGLSLGTEETAAGETERLVEHVQPWFELSVRWIRDFDKL